MKNKKVMLIQERLYEKWFAVAPGVWGLKDIFVNVYLIHSGAGNHWVLVDTGLPTAARKIEKVAAHLFWPQTQPSAIILTHGHFDHTGSVKRLAAAWDVPVYAHFLEAPYLTGQAAYPPPDPTAGGGLMTWLSCLFPRRPANISGRLLKLPEDGSIPMLPGWRYLHTPGHAPGHISVYREADGVLLAGDAVVTTQQESLFSAITQARKLSGPPRYFTCNWQEAAHSVRKLAELEPNVIATGHGKPMEGEGMRAALHKLADNFEATAVPAAGRYVPDGAVAGVNGMEYVPPPKAPQLLFKAAVALALAGMGVLLYRYARSKRY